MVIQKTVLTTVIVSVLGTTLLLGSGYAVWQKNDSKKQEAKVTKLEEQVGKINSNIGKITALQRQEAKINQAQALTLEQEAQQIKELEQEYAEMATLYTNTQQSIDQANQAMTGTTTGTTSADDGCAEIYIEGVLYMGAGCGSSGTATATGTTPTYTGDDIEEIVDDITDSYDERTEEWADTAEDIADDATDTWEDVNQNRIDSRDEDQQNRWDFAQTLAERNKLQEIVAQYPPELRGRVEAAQKQLVRGEQFNKLYRQAVSSSGNMLLARKNLHGASLTGDPAKISKAQGAFTRVTGAEMSKLSRMPKEMQNKKFSGNFMSRMPENAVKAPGMDRVFANTERSFGGSFSGLSKSYERSISSRDRSSVSLPERSGSRR